MNIFQIIKSWLLKQPDEPQAHQQSEHRSQPEYDWQYLVTPGHVIFARMNYLSFIGTRLMIALLASFVVFYYCMGYAINLIAKLDNVKPTTQRVVVDTQKIAYASRNFQLDSRTKPTKVEELPVYIKDSLASLNDNNKLAVPCNISTSIAGPWASKEGSVEYPMCTFKVASSGKPKRIYTFAIVNANGDYKNWIGVFYHDKSWKYKNLNLQGFYLIPKFENIESSRIVNTIKSDFTDLPLLNSKTEIYDND